MFDPPLKKIAKDVEKDIDRQSADMFAATALQLFSRIVVRTPVDTGAARGGWQVSIFRPDLSGGQSNPNASIITVPNNPKLADFWLSNPLPYIERLEFGTYGTGAGATMKTTRDGFSVQAPFGMIRISMTELGL